MSSVRFIGFIMVLAAILAAGLLTLSNTQAATSGWHGHAQPPVYQERIFPPWGGGKNNSAVHQGLRFTVPEVDDLADFHGDPFNARLVLYIGGNYYFAVAPLVAAFEKLHPRLKGKVYAETLPPGILLRQIKAGGTITVGNMTWTARPDVYAAGKLKIQALIHAGILRGPVFSYTTNDLAIMVPRGNPGHIRTLSDLGKPGVRLAMPNPAWEGVARQIQLSLKKAGGPALEKRVYQSKVADGQTILTHIHHRQTPLFLMQGLVVAGVTWKSEAIFQKQIGHPISYVPIPSRYNTTAIYAGAVVRNAQHPKAAMEWLQFLRSPTAQAIFDRYGFRPLKVTAQSLDPATPKVSALKHELSAIFSPPPESQMPHGRFGKMIILGRNIFDHTRTYAPKYVGNGLSCMNCHLQSGRLAYSAPLWAAYVIYPRYQAKARGVVTFQKRLQECFLASMNGKSPPADGKVITALTSYAAWLATGATVGTNLPGRGYKFLTPAALPPSTSRGRVTFTQNCVVCHQSHGQGLLTNGRYVYPPLWGPHSYNMGAGMAKVKMAAAFIKANMPYNKPGSLTDQQAWDVAKFVDSHRRPPAKGLPR